MTGYPVKTCYERFIFSAGMILLLTGIAKIWSAFGDAKILADIDPLFGLRFRLLILGAGTLEFVIAIGCFGKCKKLATIFIAWLATSLLAYRLSLWEIGWRRPCSCLGNFTDALHIPPQTADTVMKIILAYLLIGSYATLFWLWRQRKKTVPPIPA